MTDQGRIFNTKTSTAFVVFVLVALTLSHIHQGTLGVDAIRYASIARHIVETGTWFPLFDSYTEEVYYNKPPILFWMVATSFKLLGYSTFSARIVGALFTFAGMLLFWNAIRTFYDDKIAFFSIIIIAANADFFRSVVDLNFEGILLCAGALLLHAGLSRVRHGRFSHDDRIRLVIGVLFFLATKPPCLLFVVPAYLSFDYLSLDWKTSTTSQKFRRIMRRVILAGVLCLAGFALILLLFPIDFVLHTLSRQLLEPFIFTQSYVDNLGAWLKNIFLYLIPGSVVGIAAVLFPLADGRRMISKTERRFLMLWLAPVVAVIIITESRTRYLHIPFLALAILGAEYLTVKLGEKGFERTKQLFGFGTPVLWLGIALFGLPLHIKEPVTQLFLKHPELLDRSPIICAGGSVDGDIYAPSVKRLGMLIEFSFNRTMTVIPPQKLDQAFQMGPSTMIIANKKCIDALDNSRWARTKVMEEPGVEVVIATGGIGTDSAGTPH